MAQQLGRLLRAGWLPPASRAEWREAGFTDIFAALSPAPSSMTSTDHAVVSGTEWAQEDRQKLPGSSQFGKGTSRIFVALLSCRQSFSDDHGHPQPHKLAAHDRFISCSFSCPSTPLTSALLTTSTPLSATGWHISHGSQHGSPPRSAVHTMTQEGKQG